MKKINVKTVVIFVILLVVIVLGVVAVTQVKTFMSSASSSFEPTNVVVNSGDDGKTATITWTSEKDSVAQVEYGTTAASLVLMMAENTATTNHNLSLSSLRPGTTYYYRIRIGEEIFDNGGVPYSFKTKSDSETLVSPTVTPVVSGGSVCDTKTDYNKDGAINTVDLLVCKKNGGTIAVPTTSTVKTITPTKTVNNTPTIDCKKTKIDYNSDGVVNTVDIINCLRSQK